MADEKKPPGHDYLPEPYPMTPEERARIYAKIKAEFTAADLQRFFEIEELIPMDDVMKELEAILCNAPPPQE